MGIRITGLSSGFALKLSSPTILQRLVQ